MDGEGADSGLMVAVAAVRARSAAAMTERPWASAEARQANLTEREWEVLEILVTGASTREISAQLCISPRTVTNHLASIYGKLGTHTRTQAVARALGLSKKNGHS